MYSYGFRQTLFIRFIYKWCRIQEAWYWHCFWIPNQYLVFLASSMSLCKGLILILLALLHPFSCKIFFLDFHLMSSCILASYVTVWSWQLEIQELYQVLVQIERNHNHWIQDTHLYFCKITSLQSLLKMKLAKSTLLGLLKWSMLVIKQLEKLCQISLQWTFTWYD